MGKLLFALSFLLLSSRSFALDDAGVNVAPTVSVHQKTLTLNGVGIRKKLFIKVYVGSLYTERKVTTPAPKADRTARRSMLTPAGIMGIHACDRHCSSLPEVAVFLITMHKINISVYASIIWSVSDI